MPGAWRNFFIAVSKPASPEPLGSSLPASAPGATPAITAFVAMWRLAGGEPYAGRLAAGGRDLGDLRAGERSCRRPPSASSSSAMIIVSAPPLPSTMPKALVGHRFEIGEDRAAGDVGREVEMHAPGGERRLDMRRTRNSRRARRAARRAAGAPYRARRQHPSCARAFQAVPASARPLIGEPSRRNRCSASPGKPPTRRRQVSASAAENAAMRGDRLFEVGADAEPAPVREDAGEAIGHRSEFQPGRFQFICIFPVEGGAGEEAEIHRAEIVPEARKRALRASAPRRRSTAISLENRDFPAFQRQMRGAGQTVVARPDKYGVELAHAPDPNSFRLKDNCRCICFRLVGY